MCIKSVSLERTMRMRNRFLLLTSHDPMEKRKLLFCFITINSSNESTLLEERKWCFKQTVQHKALSRYSQNRYCKNGSSNLGLDLMCFVVQRLSDWLTAWLIPMRRKYEQNSIVFPWCLFLKINCVLSHILASPNDFWIFHCFWYGIGQNKFWFCKPKIK